MGKVIETKQLTRTYQVGDIAVEALKGIDLTVNEGEFVAIMGASGSGKSTFMNLLGCLDSPTSGEYYLDGTEISSLKPDEYADIRNEKIGFVFQGFNLLARTTAIENVELPLLYDRKRRIRNPGEAARAALERLGLGDRIHHEPNQMSGGQQQRVAIARALVNQPSLVLADEPTGNLDSRTSIDIMSVFQELNRQGITMVLVTHERDMARYAQRIVELRDGKVKRNVAVENIRDAKQDLANYREEE